MIDIDQISGVRPGEGLYAVLLSVFSGSLVLAGVLAFKIVSIGPYCVPAGVFSYCLTFVCTDVISELWGRKRASQAVWAGFVSLLSALLLIQLALFWPAAPFWQQEKAFHTVLSAAPRIILGSLSAYLLSQFHDVWAFHFWKKLCKGRHLWIRNNLSTIVSQFLDSTVFIFIAFWGVLPLWPLILGQWLVKMVIALADTGLVYLLVWWARHHLNLLPAVP